MKVAKALLIFPCLCLLNACQGSKELGTETSLSVASSPQKIETTKEMPAEEELLKDLNEVNLNLLLERKIISKNSALTILYYYKDHPESQISKQILQKNKSLIADELVSLQLEKSSSNNLKELLIDLGDESYYSFSKIFTYASENEKKQLVSILKEETTAGMSHI